MPCRSSLNGSFCGFCYANMTGRSNYSGHRRYVKPRPKIQLANVREWMKKPTRDASAASSSQSSRDIKFASSYPILWEWLTTERWEDGSPRKTSTLFMFADMGRWKVMFKDRDANTVVFVSGESLDDCFTALEVGLIDNSLDWRRDQGAGPRKK